MQELCGGEFVARIHAAHPELMACLDVITEADILTVSDGRSHVTAHAGGTYQVVTSELELLGATLDEARQVGKVYFLIFHLF